MNAVTPVGGRGHRGGTGVVGPAWVAVVAVLDGLERHQYHWPVGRLLFRRLIYFATKAGVPTGLHYRKGGGEPYANGVKRMTAQLQDSGFLAERQLGRMREVRVGPAYHRAATSLRQRIELWRPMVVRTTDLMTRMDSQTAEVASLVYFETERLTARHSCRPAAGDVLDAVAGWRSRHKPQIARSSIIEGLLLLALTRWIDVELDQELETVVDELVEP